MKKVSVLGLGLALSGAAASTCIAQPSSGPKMACTRAQTPARGSTTRKQIAEAMRRNLGTATGVYAVFVFDWLKVSGNWAYTQTSPESPDGSSKYEPVSALLRRSNGRWSVAARLNADSDTSPAQALRRVRRRFPSAPSDIFPR